MQYIVQKSPMHPNTKLLHDFYLAFQDKNHSGMQACYAEDAHFSDPVFQNLNTLQVRKMWEMLVTRGKDLQIVFSDIEADDQKGKAHWVATYTCSPTGTKGVNDINATFECVNGSLTQ
ncbi:MAG: nuclear transport factor 2 family protein, partial [Flavobacteriales bacterium]|nr:nuclear transport factor 2 family protein [Flavobacteriales bacterium]